MKTTLGAAAALLMATTVAGSAADTAARSPAYLSPAFSWSGFYAGLHMGYGWGTNDWNFVELVEFPGSTVTPAQNPKTNGVLAGVQAGANYQIASWVIGMEAEWTFMRGNGSADAALTINNGIAGVTTTATSKIDWLAMFTGRFGYAFDRTLLYAKGGVAAAEYKDDFAFLVPAVPPQFVDFGTHTNTLVGWTAGAGIEHAFTPNWSVKIEYDYVDLGTTAENFSMLGATFRENIHHKVQIVKVGGNYRF